LKAPYPNAYPNAVLADSPGHRRTAPSQRLLVGVQELVQSQGQACRMPERVSIAARATASETWP
jgi:hypothetical protein